MEGGGGVPNTKVTKSSERNNTTGKQNYWISGLSEYNHFYSLLQAYLNDLITSLVLNICPLSGHVSSNCIYLDKQAQTRQNKPLPHF